MPGRSAASRLPAALVSLLAMLLLLGTANAAAAPGVVQDLPGCRESNLPANDDDSTDLVQLGFEATIFDRDFTQAYVNNNGTITFDADQGEYTPFDFRETGSPFIAPFFADVDTRGVGSGLVHYGQTTVDGNAAFCVIWDHVGYYSEHADKTNTFQALLVDQGDAGLDVILNYDSIAWETGSASGGIDGFGGDSAAAGYAAGDGDSAHAAVLPGSFANGALLDSNPQTSLAGHSTSGQPAGRYLFQLRLGPPTGGRLVGQIRDPGGTVNDGVSGAIAQICRQSDGKCITRIADSSGNYRASNLPQGAYRVTGFTGPDDEFRSTTIDDVPVPGPPNSLTQNIVLGPEPAAPPAGTTVEPRIDDRPEEGVPSTDWTDALRLSTEGCEGGDASFRLLLEGEVLRTGSLVEGPLGTYTGSIAPLQPDHGTGEIQIDINCPGSVPDVDIDFGIYIDPSGVVSDAGGNLVEDARVTLFRSSSPDGPFFAVPFGAAVMSPSNRRNPDVTDANGHFGWDVIAGYYVVRAERRECGAQSEVLTIPPPVTNLNLRLSCPPAPIFTPGPVIINPPPPPPPAPRRRLARIGTVKLVKGKTLTTKVSCARTARTACSGKVSVRIGRKAVGSRRFKGLKPGRSKNVKVTLTKRGRKLVRKVKKGKKVRFALSVTVRDAAGVGATARRTVSIRR